MYVADTKRLTAAGAKQLMAAALGLAEQAGIAVTVAVADAGGHLLLLERMEGGRFHTVHSATTKAVCAASNRRITGPRGAQGQTLDASHAIGLALAAGPANFTAMEGGCPIFFGSVCVGGIGVAGGSFELDERIARAAVESIGASVGEPAA
jgi:glc operon protein GlcG